MLDLGGTATVIGMVPSSQKLEIKGMDLLAEKKLQGSMMGSNQFRVDMPNMVRMYLDGRLLLDEMVSAHDLPRRGQRRLRRHEEGRGRPHGHQLPQLRTRGSSPVTALEWRPRSAGVSGHLGLRRCGPRITIMTLGSLFPRIADQNDRSLGTWPRFRAAGRAGAPRRASGGGRRALDGLRVPGRRARRRPPRVRAGTRRSGSGVRDPASLGEAQDVRAAVARGCGSRSRCPPRSRRPRSSTPSSPAPTSSGPAPVGVSDSADVSTEYTPNSSALSPVGVRAASSRPVVGPGHQPHVEEDVGALGRHVVDGMGLDRSTAISHYLHNTTNSQQLERSSGGPMHGHDQMPRPRSTTIVAGGPTTSSPSATSALAGTPARDRAGARRGRRGRPRRRGLPRPAVDPTVERVRRRWFAANHPAHASACAASPTTSASTPTTPSVTSTGSAPTTCRPAARSPSTRARAPRTATACCPATSTSRPRPHPDHRPPAARPANGRWPPTRGSSSCTPTTATHRSSSGSWTSWGPWTASTKPAWPSPSSPTTRRPNRSRPADPQVGLAEQQVVRYLLDTCATVDEAKEALLVGQALLLLHAVPLRRRRPVGRVLRVGALAPPQPRG